MDVNDILLDREHLARQTFGDEALARELLDLFAEQCRRLGPAIADEARGPDDRADLAHTLKGSALGVGANRIAVLASRIEAALRNGDRPQAADLTGTLAGVIGETVAVL
ncbi:Hpt domain-containing protein [Methylobacterium oryzihabitans]|uniref:Hpt domain-containing protein n=1 Tax=Methylobacterium oryzihabitans TaxID=2499852 RepID=A0A437P2S3_9HYPH|nr:Hpt domain-containing protein [Methylobacterium oryzihabitans]RVU16573.1 Hpt domain-containing protein [Methylobacterium oryzihabitans]